MNSTRHSVGEHPPPTTWKLAICLSSWALYACTGCTAEASGSAATATTATTATEVTGQKIGVLLINHGSRSETWRGALLELERNVEPAILADGRIADVRTAFMEYTEPSIATRMREFDAEGFTDVLIVPVFLTVSTHSFDDIPTILGDKEDPKSLELLRLEGIERYRPKARTHLGPLLDFSNMLASNVTRRVRSLSTDPAEEGLVLIGYGDQTYEEEWSALMNRVGEHVEREVGITKHAHGWCGHLVHYDPAKTTQPIERVLETKRRAIVVPVLVAHDEMFQVQIIGDGIAAVDDADDRVVYRPDAILPDPEVEEWVVSAVSDMRADLGVSAAGRVSDGPRD